MGAWIEILLPLIGTIALVVAPFVGAWIEICFVCDFAILSTVAPFVGAWIEMDIHGRSGVGAPGRSLRGSVD